MKQHHPNKSVTNSIYSFLFILLLHLYTAPTFAIEQNRGLGFYFDQDLLVPLLNQDRDYTMGMAVEFFWEKEKGLYPLDNLVKHAGRWFGLKELDNNVIYSFMLGTVNYTPDDLSNPLPILNDRPYSSLIYLSNKRVRADKNNAVAAEVLLGILGTNVAKEAQTALHSIWRDVSGSDEPVTPQGWGHQISNGGELTMRARFANSHLQQNLSKPGTWDVATTWGVSLGYQTNISASVAIRAGNINSSFWSLPFDPVNRGNFLPSGVKNEWYLWTAYRMHLVGYDALLQGQFRNSDVTFASDQIEKIVHDGAIGLTVGIDKSQITFSVNAKSAELKNTQKRRHYWGSVNYLFNF